MEDWCVVDENIKCDIKIVFNGFEDDIEVIVVINVELKGNWNEFDY